MIDVEALTRWEVRDILGRLEPEKLRLAYFGGDHGVRIDAWTFEKLEAAIRDDDGRRVIDLIRESVRAAA